MASSFLSLPRVLSPPPISSATSPCFSSPFRPRKVVVAPSPEEEVKCTALSRIYLRTVSTVRLSSSFSYPADLHLVGTSSLHSVTEAWISGGRSIVSYFETPKSLKFVSSFTKGQNLAPAVDWNGGQNTGSYGCAVAGDSPTAPGFDSLIGFISDNSECFGGTTVDKLFLAADAQLVEKVETLLGRGLLRNEIAGILSKVDLRRFFCEKMVEEIEATIAFLKRYDVGDHLLLIKKRPAL